MKWQLRLLVYQTFLPDGTHAPVQVYINEIEAPAYELIKVRDCALYGFTPNVAPKS